MRDIYILHATLVACRFALKRMNHSFHSFGEKNVSHAVHCITFHMIIIKRSFFNFVQASPHNTTLSFFMFEFGPGYHSAEPSIGHSRHLPIRHGAKTQQVHYANESNSAASACNEGNEDNEASSISSKGLDLFIVYFVSADACMHEHAHMHTYV